MFDYPKRPIAVKEAILKIHIPYIAKADVQTWEKRIDFFYGFFGFFIIYPIIILDSLLIFFSSKILIKSKLFKFFFKKDIYKDYRLVKINKSSSNNYIFILSRYIFPYFMHNIIYGVLNISRKKFLYLIVLSEIPLTYAFIMLGNSLKDFMYEEINVIKIF